MRIVADTNTLVSGLLWQGAPRRLIEAAFAGQLTLVTSQALLSELAEVLVREKFASRIRKARISARALVEDYGTIAHLVEPIQLSRTVTRDPDDDQVIACAIAGDVEAIVSGDDDLLAIGEYQGVPILNAAQALEKLASQR